MSITVEVDIRASKEKIWDAIIDIENATDMISGITALEILDRPKVGLVGLKWTETRKMFGKEAKETMWITDYEEFVYYRTRAENHGAVYVSKLAIEEIGDVSRLSIGFSMSSDSLITRMISSLMGALMKRSMKKLLLGDANDIKRFVESRAT